MDNNCTCTGTCRARVHEVGLGEMSYRERDGGVIVLSVGSWNLACVSPAPSRTTKKTKKYGTPHCQMMSESYLCIGIINP